jgi:hypothetical protein
MSKPVKPSEVVLCDLPAETINCTIGTELDIAKVVLSRAAQKHAAKKHAADYPRCFPHLARIISDPLYIGDDDKNPGSIELIGRIPGLTAEFMLVAVKIEVDEGGRYHVTSFYIVSERKIASRRDKGFLMVAQKA